MPRTQKGSNRSSNQGPGKAKGNNQPKKSSPSKKGKSKDRTQSMGAAMNNPNVKFIGMKDLEAHRVSWIAGAIYVGNGTNGATDSVYFQTNGAQNVPGTSGGGQVPILGSDAGIGQTYVADIEKHYSRKVVRRAKVKLLSVQPATSNSMVALIAPVRGPAASGDTVTFGAATTAAPTYGSTVGMTGVVSAPSYKDAEIDLTPYIAGGSGAKQNEFSINRDGDTAGTAWGSGTVDLVGIAPCAFVVSGVNGTTGLRGAITHYVVVETVCDYLDFLGGNSNPNPLAFMSSVSKEEAMICLRGLLALPQKEVRDFALVKALVKRVNDSHKDSCGLSL